MTHHPNDDLQTELEALAEVFEAEDREDRRKQAQRRRDGLPEPKRDIRARTAGPLPAAEPLLLSDPRLLQEHARDGVLGTVLVEIGDEMGEGVRGALGCLEHDGDQGLLVGRSLHAPGL